MKRRVTNAVLLVLEMIALVSTWWSIRPASEWRYEKLRAQEAAQPGSVPGEAWVMSKDDEGMTSLGLIVLGVPGFLIATFFASAWAVSISGLKHLGILVGACWILLAACLHAWAWLGG